MAHIQISKLHDAQEDDMDQGKKEEGSGTEESCDAWVGCWGLTMTGKGVPWAKFSQSLSSADGKNVPAKAQSRLEGEW